MQEQFGDDLAVLLVMVDYSYLGHVGMMALAAKRGWLGGEAIWTKELPFDLGFWKEGMTPDGDHLRLPAVALINARGEVVLRGGYSELHNGNRLEKAVEQEAERRQHVVSAAPKSVARAWNRFTSGNAAKALALLDALVLNPKSDDAEEQRRILDALSGYHARIEEWLARCESLIELGHYTAAVERLNRLQGGLKGRERYTQRIATLLARLDSDELAVERAAEDKLLALEKKLYKKGPSKTTAKALQALAERDPHTKAASRALELAVFARITGK